MPKVSKITSRRPKATAAAAAPSDDNSSHESESSPPVPSLPPIRGARAAATSAKKGSSSTGGGGGENTTATTGSCSTGQYCADVAAAPDDEDAMPQVAGAWGDDTPDASASQYRSSDDNADGDDFDADLGGNGQESWNAMLYQLLLFKAQRGDLNVPHNDAGYAELNMWVQTQRKHYQDNKTSSAFLNADRIAVLDAIDFQWNLRGDTLWQKNFDALVVFQAEHGHVKVPRLYEKNSKLGEWVTDQRRQLKFKLEGKPTTMTDERKNKLDELGFVWQVRDRSDWNDRYEKMLEFKKETGHCIVPQHYAPNRSLGKWVAKQREQYRFYCEGKHSFLTEERIDLLKAVGFVFQIKGRGVNKSKANKSKSSKAQSKSERKSLAKMEKTDEDMEEEKLNADISIVRDNERETHSPHLTPFEMTGMEYNPIHSLPTMPTIAQQQFIQANMDAIATHASNRHIMAAQLAAVLGLGGGINPNALPLGDPAMAMLRAAHMDESGTFRV